MNAIIRDDVEPLPSALPAPMRWTIERCLSKDPDQRYDSTRDLYRELRQMRDGLSQTLGLPAAAVGAAPRARWGRPWAAAAVLAVVGAALLGGWLQSVRHIVEPT